MALMTDLGKEIISMGMVGDNIKYEILKSPKKLAYPKGDEVRYSDDYIFKLNELYNMNDMLGNRIEKLAQGYGIEHFVMGSPLNNSEGEDILGHILFNSAKAKQWQPFIIDVPFLKDAKDIPTAKEYLDRVQKISPNYNRGMIDGGLLFGLSVAKRGGFVLPFDYDNKVIIVPSQPLIEYFDRQK
jgi:hypothetical protein